MQTQIVVRENVAGKFGPQLKDKDGYLNFGKFYTGLKEFEPGTTLDVELYVTDKGGRYINKAVIVPGAAPAIVAPIFNNTPVATPLKKAAKVKAVAAEDENSKWDKINRGKVKSLFIEALLSNPGVTSDMASLEFLNSAGLQEQLNKLVESVF